MPELHGPPTRDAVIEEKGGLISRPWLAWITKELVPAIVASAPSVALTALEATVTALAATVAAADAALATAIGVVQTNLDALTSRGDFTPVLAFGGVTTGITYTTQIGTWEKVGRKVTVSFQITLSSKGAAAGSASVSGLPFAAKNLTGTLLWGAVVIAASMSGLTTPITGRIVGGTSAMDFFDWSATTITAIDDTNFTNTSVVAATATYLAES